MKLPKMFTRRSKPRLTAPDLTEQYREAIRSAAKAGAPWAPLEYIRDIDGERYGPVNALGVMVRKVVDNKPHEAVHWVTEDGKILIGETIEQDVLSKSRGERIPLLRGDAFRDRKDFEALRPFVRDGIKRSKGIVPEPQRSINAYHRKVQPPVERLKKK
jgi:hypothetical protein